MGSWRLTSVVAAAVMLPLAGCGQSFHSVGRVTTTGSDRVCASFSNGIEQCFPLSLFEGGDPALPCIRVHFAGESADPLDARYVVCEASTTSGR